MAFEKDVVDVIVSLAGRPITTAGFDTPLFVAEHAIFAERTRRYSSADAAVTDGFATDGDVHKFLTNLFSGSFAPKSAVIGRREALESFADAIVAIADEDSDWYFLSEASHDNTSMQAAASYAAANDKHYVYSTQEADTLVTANETNIAHLLRTAQFEGCTGMYHQDADTEYPEGAMIGAWSGTNPGTSTLHGKTLPGVTVSDITESQKEALKTNNLNYYVFTYGVGFFFNGETASGLFSDQVRLKHWTQARVAESVFNVFKRESDLGGKIEMSPVGFAKVRMAIQEIIDLGIRRGAFLGDPQPTISIPTREEIPEILRNQRLLPDVTFTVTSSGGVHSVEIRGFVVS